MKKTLLLLAALAVVFASCKKDNASGPEGNNETYTILICGASGAGSNLDYDEVSELVKIAQKITDNQVNVVVQYNYRAAAQSDLYPYIKGTQRMIYLPGEDKSFEDPYDKKETEACKTAADTNRLYARYCNQMIGEMVEKQAVRLSPAVAGGGLVRLYEPENIADFINFAAKECPADHYIFSVSGHGGGWCPEDDGAHPTTRKASGWDENFGDAPITAKDLAQGIKLSSVASKVICIMQDACMMNAMENVSEYATTGVPYAMLSTETTNGAELHKLIDYLRKATSFEWAMMAYVPEAVTSDWCVWDMNHVGEIQNLIKQSVPMIAESYQKKELNYDSLILTLDHESSSSFYCRNLYGFYSYLEYHLYLGDSLQVLSTSITKRIREDAFVYYGRKMTISPSKEDLRVTANFINKHDYDSIMQIPASAQAIRDNTFYQSTGWNSLFSLFNYSIPKPEAKDEDDEDED